MNEQMKELRLKLAYDVYGGTGQTLQYKTFLEGFDACYAEIAPVIEALGVLDAIGLPEPYDKIAREALKKIGVENE